MRAYEFINFKNSPILLEALIIIDDLKIWKNPVPTQVKQLLSNIKILRGFYIESTRSIFVADAMYIYHEELFSMLRLNHHIDKSINESDITKFLIGKENEDFMDADWIISAAYNTDSYVRNGVEIVWRTSNITPQILDYLKDRLLGKEISTTSNTGSI